MPQIALWDMACRPRLGARTPHVSGFRGFPSCSPNIPQQKPEPDKWHTPEGSTVRPHNHKPRGITCTAHILSSHCHQSGATPLACRSCGCAYIWGPDALNTIKRLLQNERFASNSPQRCPENSPTLVHSAPTPATTGLNTPEAAHNRSKPSRFHPTSGQISPKTNTCCRSRAHIDRTPRALIPNNFGPTTANFGPMLAQLIDQAT